MDVMARKPAEILAVIPARGGSRGVPNKNIRKFAGKPLIVHSIDAAKKASSVSRVIVWTDSEEIASVARAAGAEVTFLRPAELATDESKIVDAVIYLLEKLQKDEGYTPTHVLLLQPTSPLRTPDDIEKAVELMEKRGADSLVSVCRTENLLFTKDAGDALSMLNAEGNTSPNRQELQQCYKLDGSMIYLVKADVLLKEHSFLAGKLVGYEIERWRAIDIDEPQDLVAGGVIFERQDEISKAIRNFS